jgi:uncharacterized membrane protein
VRTTDRVFFGAGALTIVDTLYVTWRYLLLHARLVTPRTGFCSWTTTRFLRFPLGIDCDPVLLSRPARAFYVPNATLGLGFFLGCVVFYAWCLRRDERVQYVGVQLMAFWLSLATLFTFRFYSLLVHLPSLCPVCPWNHLLTWVMTIAIWIRLRTTPRPAGPPARIELVGPCIAGVSIFVGAQMLWAVPWVLGKMTP